MRKIKSGVYGLNPLLDGGINERSTTVVIGSAGTGKTTFAIQFIRKGLRTGQFGVFVSLDENKDQIMREAIEMGWHEIQDYIDDMKLVFIDASGKKFAEFIKEELPIFVEEWKGTDARIAIDPLTPVIWTTENRYELRELLSFLLKDARKIGTVLCTLEEHGTLGNLSGEETIIPMYLADCVIHLRHAEPGNPTTGYMRIIKCRNSRHSKLFHGYRIVRGFGMVVEPTPFSPKKTVEIITRLKKEIEKELKISPTRKEEISKFLLKLQDDDLDGLTTDQILKSILDEEGE